MIERIEYYNEYARICGFDFWHSTTKKSRDGTVLLKHLVCNRERVSRNVKKRMTTRDIVDVDDFVSCASIQKKTVSRGYGCREMLVLKHNRNGGYVFYVFVEVHKHRLVTAEGRQFWRSSMVMLYEQKRFVFDASKVQISPRKPHHLMKELVDGFERVGATVI